MVPDAQVFHGMPRRLRIKIPSKKGCKSYFSDLSDGLSRCPGVECVQVNPVTGSVMVMYDGDIKALADYARTNGLFSLQRATPVKRTLFQEVAATFQSYNRNLKQMTGGEVDIPGLVFLSLLVSGIWQIARGNLVMPAWYTAFYYALGVFTTTKVDEFDAGEDLTGESVDAGTD